MCICLVKVDIELELERVLLEKADVQDDLMKLESICANHESDKARLHDEVKKVEKPALDNNSMRLSNNGILNIDSLLRSWRRRERNWRVNRRINRAI